jgi:hypothetical protein
MLLGSAYLYMTFVPSPPPICFIPEIRLAGGIMTASDIEGYKPAQYKPLNSTFMGHTYIGVGKGGGGGGGILFYFFFVFFFKLC